MTHLLFEFWQTSDGKECSLVSAEADQQRQPDDVFIASFRASSQDEAMQIYYDLNRWGAYQPVSRTASPTFSEAEAQHQDDYLKVRVFPVRLRPTSLAA